MDRIRFAIKHTEQFGPQTEPMPAIDHFKSLKRIQEFQTCLAVSETIAGREGKKSRKQHHE
jgi:hypothetical protein